MLKITLMSGRTFNANKVEISGPVTIITRFNNGLIEEYLTIEISVIEADE